MFLQLKVILLFLFQAYFKYVELYNNKFKWQG